VFSQLSDLIVNYEMCEYRSLHGEPCRIHAPGLLGRHVALDAAPDLASRMDGHGLAPATSFPACDEVISNLLERQPSLLQQRVKVLELGPQPGIRLRASNMGLTLAWCMDQKCGRIDPNPVRGHAIRT